MAALRVMLFRDDDDIETWSLPKDQWYKVVLAVNALWKSIETPEVQYRTLPDEADGELYVTPGLFGECRCSHGELMLEDEYDLDDSHFYQTRLPDDIREKYMLYYHEEEGGYLRRRMFVGEKHPLHGTDGLMARFDIVYLASEGEGAPQ